MIHVVTDPEHVAHGEVHWSQESPVAEVMKPVGHVSKQLFTCKIGYGLEQAVQLLVVPEHEVQLFVQASQTFAIATWVVGQVVHWLLYRFKVPVQEVQFVLVVEQVAHVESHAIQLVPLV